MKTLSIQNPWAWAILNGKPVENRDWHTNVRGRILIHVGKKYDAGAVGFIESQGLNVPADLPLGGIVGSVEIVDCVTEYDSPWFFGKFGFVLRNPITLPFMPCRGQLGFFEVEYKKEDGAQEIAGGRFTSANSASTQNAQLAMELDS
jgi:ASCH domain